MSENLLDAKISVVLNQSDTEASGEITVREFLAKIRDAKAGHVAKIEKIRSLSALSKTKKDQHDIAAANIKDTLPNVILSGVITGKRKQAMQEGRMAHSGLIQLDIDAKDIGNRDPLAVRDTIGKDEHVLAAFLSPSGKGVKALVRVPQCATDEQHKAAWQSMSEYFATTYELEADTNTKDAGRLFYLSHDSHCIAKLSARELPITTKPKEKKPDAPRVKNESNFTLADLAGMIAKIPRPAYADWLAICSGAWNTFGQDATPILKAQWAEDKHGEYDEKFPQRTSEHSIATVIHHAKAYGWKPEKKSQRMALVLGVNGFPTDPPPETVLVGDGAIRIGDIAMLNSGAGMGKSVGIGQLAMAWALGLPYFGIKPARPLRILHYVGEDDESTMGQIREGFLAHSLAITGKQLTAKDLEPLDEMLATQFDRSAIGKHFIAEMKNDIEAFKPDMVFINPLLSYIGGDPVKEATDFLRGGIMPVLAANKCAALIAHHTCKLHRDSWESMDPTYSGIGGSEMANVPRIVLTIMPAGEGVIRLQAGKRTTVGWKDEQGKYRDHAYFRRTDNPTRPAWLPMSYEEGETRPEKAEGARRKKVSTADIVDILKNGDRLKAAVMDDLMATPCGHTTARDVIKHALQLEEIFEWSEKKKPAHGGSPRKWLTLTPPQDDEEAGGENNSPPDLAP
jgi:hypothetical protein